MNAAVEPPGTANHGHPLPARQGRPPKSARPWRTRPAIRRCGPCCACWKRKATCGTRRKGCGTSTCRWWRGTGQAVGRQAPDGHVFQRFAGTDCGRAAGRFVHAAHARGTGSHGGNDRESQKGGQVKCLRWDETAWLAFLASAALKSTVVLALAWGVAKLLRSRSAAWRHLVWTAAAAAVLALPFLSWGCRTARAGEPAGASPSAPMSTDTNAEAPAGPVASPAPAATTQLPAPGALAAGLAARPDGAVGRGRRPGTGADGIGRGGHGAPEGHGAARGGRGLQQPRPRSWASDAPCRCSKARRGACQ